jgi:hypothetical protein
LGDDGIRLRPEEAKAFARKIVNNKHIDAIRKEGTADDNRDAIGSRLANEDESDKKNRQHEKLLEIAAKLKTIAEEYRRNNRNNEAALAGEPMKLILAGCEPEDLQPSKWGVSVRKADIAAGKLTEESAKKWACLVWAKEILPRL